MNDLERLDRFLRTDPRDVGCDEAMAVLHIYVDLLVTGGDAAQRYPGVAAHLLACGQCAEDLAGLLTAVTDGQPGGDGREVLAFDLEYSFRLVTCNAFDSVGASEAGMRTAWVNRSGDPFDPIGRQPDLTVPVLDRLPAALAG